MTTQTYDNPSIGCYVDASAQSADECNERTIKFAQQYGFETNFWSEPTEADEDYSQLLSEEADRALDALNSLETRSFMFWTFEDNSLFLIADVDLAREDCEFVSSKSQDYPPADYQGEWLHITDHGNATLYVRQNGQDKEIWSCV